MHTVDMQFTKYCILYITPYLTLLSIMKQICEEILYPPYTFMYKPCEKKKTLYSFIIMTKDCVLMLAEN